MYVIVEFLHDSFSVFRTVLGPPLSVRGACGDLAFARVKSHKCTFIITRGTTVAPWPFMRYSRADLLYLHFVCSIPRYVGPYTLRQQQQALDKV